MKEGINKFSSVIVGGGTLPIRCAEILLRAGHSICAVASSDPGVQRWCDENGILSLAPGEKLAEQIETAFDCLFSIVNEHILDEQILRLPRKLAVNYHDAPLPRYAGTHATSWALINGETEHGITWQEITKLVDGGDILKQRRIEIAADETAFTLNTKCYEAASEAFAELIGDISSGRLERKKQDLNDRTFFARYKRPANGAVIRWESSSSEISALVRALDLGPHPNSLGVAKVARDGSFLIVRSAEVSDGKTGSPPGTINEIGSDLIRVSTRDKDVILRRISLLDGEPISVADFAARVGLCVGTRFRSITEETAKRIDETVSATAKSEVRWVRAIAELEPVALPLPYSISSKPEYKTVEISVPKKFGDTSETKPSESLAAAFGAFIARVTGKDHFDLAYSSPRLRERVSGIEGLFASRVPLRFEVDGFAGFDQVLKTTEESIGEVTRRGPFACDLFARYPQFGASSATLPIAIDIGSPQHKDRIEAANELTFCISELPDECCFLYDANRFDPESIERLAESFTAFLGGIGNAPDLKVAHIPLLSDEERRKVLVDWNSDRIRVRGDQCIHHLFEAQVGRSPDAVALIVGRERLTYSELNRRANRMAWHLRSLGIGPEVPVAICLERSIEMIVGILGILKAGGAYVPLDPAYPRDRLNNILNDSGAKVLVTRAAIQERLGKHDARMVCMDGDRDHLAAMSEEDPISNVTGSDLAYVIYTSGSTGKPKGVAIEHRSTVTFLTWALSVFSPEKLKRTLASTSVCFDLSVFEMFAPLSCGGAVVLVENILHLPTAPAAGEVTLINTVPSAITELVRTGGIPDLVQTVNLAGEPLKTSLVRQIYATGTVREVYDLYGPTEDTTYSTFTLRDEGRPTIGRPISNTRAYVLDRHMQLVPVGIPGELYLGGDGLARGYLNRPDLTAERFIEDPFGDDDDRLYRTGDLVRYLPSGEIEYLGRIDNQVKIRGFRIELGEVEAVLSAHRSVMECVVAAREDQPGDKRLVAYFVSYAGGSVAVSELREHLKERLPEFMVPSAFLKLDKLPLTPNGKIDRKALPAPSSMAEPRSDLVSFRDDLESRLIGIWEDILDIRPIGINDNFFELGGHSLKAIRMFAEIEEVFGKNIPLATLFEAGTVEKLASILRKDGWSAPESSLVPIQPNGTKPPFFCIHAKGGNVLFYRDLAKHLGDEQPFYGLQARRLAGRQIGHATVEEMASFYIREMRGLQPEGPYYVGGSSFGGLVAFEIAHQLRQDGQKVALLALLDTGTPDYPRMLPTTTKLRSKIFQLVRRAQHHKDTLKAFSVKEKAGYVADKLKKTKLKYRRKIRDTYKRSVRKLYTSTLGTAAIPTSYIQIEDLIWKAGQVYSPRSYQGDVTLFRASIQPLGIYPDPTLGWAPFVDGEIKIHDVPGHHGSIVAEPYVRVLAEKLGRCLEAVHSDERLPDEEKEQSPAGLRETFRKAAVGAAS